MFSETTLLSRVRTAAAERIAAFLARGLDGLPLELETLQSASQSGEERKILAQAIAQVRPCRAAIEAGFMRGFVAAFERKLAGAAPASETEVSLDALTLVDDAAIELEIALGRLVRKTVEEIEPDQVYGIEARIGELAAGRLLESAHNPLGVEVALEALKRACDAVPEDGAVRMALANGLQPHVAAGLRHAYREVNDILAAAGVQPKLQYRVQRAQDVGVAQASPAAVPAGMSVSQAMSLRDLLPVSTGSMVDIAAVVGAMLAGTPEARRAGARILANPKGMLYGAAVATPVDPALLRALAQTAAPAFGDGAAAVRTLAPQATHPLDQLTGDLVASVFELLHADRELPEPVKRAIDRLSVTAFKAAVVDRSFFANSTHPLRKFLAEVSARAADPETDVASESTFVRELSAVVEELATAPEHDASVYENASARIGRAADTAGASRAQSLARKAAEIEQAERREIALVQARAAVQARLAGHAAPTFVAEFLCGPWAESIARAEAEQRTGPDGADRLLAVVDDLLWSIAPKGAAEVGELTAMLPRLVRALQNGASAELAPDAQQRFLDQLMPLHADVLQAARRGAGAAPGAPRAPTAAPRATGEQTLPYSAAMPALLLPVLSRGALVEFRDNSQPVRARLAWVSPRGATYLFTSGTGPARAFGRDAVNEMLGAGTLRALEAQAPAVERAIAAVTGTRAV